MNQVLKPYRMATSVARCVENEGFLLGMFREKVRCALLEHQFNFPEDIIRNEFDLQTQEIKKEKWIIYNKTIDFIRNFYKTYDPLKNFEPWARKVDPLMEHFEGIMQAVNEKRVVVSKIDPERARRILS